MDWNRATPLLEAKLDPKHVKPAKPFGPKGDYIEGWFAIQEANRIFGFGAWSYRIVDCTCVASGPRALGKDKKDGWGVTYIARVAVTVADVLREDVGAGHGYDVDLGLAHESAIKEAITDALKRVLRTFGNPFGLPLYDKERANVGVDMDTGAERDRLIKAINACTNKAQLTDLWHGEGRALVALKEAMEPHYLEVREAFKMAGEAFPEQQAA
jgi:DNA recombination protein Rad52